MVDFNLVEDTPSPIHRIASRCIQYWQLKVRIRRYNLNSKIAEIHGKKKLLFRTVHSLLQNQK